MCQHAPPCPTAHAPDREAVRIIAGHPEQGWNLLCNGIVQFDDTGMLLPDGTVIEPHRAADRTPADGLLPDRARPRRGPPCRTGLPMREGRARPRSLPSPARRGPQAARYRARRRACSAAALITTRA